MIPAFFMHAMASTILRKCMWGGGKEMPGGYWGEGISKAEESQMTTCLHLSP
jgi:hypothetical protein